MGRRYIKPGSAPDEIFVRTDVGFDRLYNRDSHFEYLPTWELIRRLQNPSFSHRSLRSQNLFLQARLVKPLLNLIVVAVGVPLVVPPESAPPLSHPAIRSRVLRGLLGADAV